MAFKPTCPTLKKVPDHEPIFVLRAQDVTAAKAVAFWLGMNPQISAERTQEVAACINAMENWPNQKSAD